MRGLAKASMMLARKSLKSDDVEPSCPSPSPWPSPRRRGEGASDAAPIVGAFSDSEGTETLIGLGDERPGGGLQFVAQPFMGGVVLPAAAPDHVHRQFRAGKRRRGVGEFPQQAEAQQAGRGGDQAGAAQERRQAGETGDEDGEPAREPALGQNDVEIDGATRFVEHADVIGVEVFGFVARRARRQVLS